MKRKYLVYLSLLILGYYFLASCGSGSSSRDGSAQHKNEVPETDKHKKKEEDKEKVTKNLVAIHLLPLAAPVGGAMVKLPINSHQLFSARGIYNDGTAADVTHTVRWQSTNSAVLAIQPEQINGVARAQTVSSGNASIYAEKEGIRSAFFECQVVPSELLKIEIFIEKSPIVHPDFPLGIRAVGYFSGEIKKDISQEVTWKGVFSESMDVDFVLAEGGVNMIVSKPLIDIFPYLKLSAQYAKIHATKRILLSRKNLSDIQILPDSLSLGHSVLTIPKGIEKKFVATGIFSGEYSYSISDVSGVTEWHSQHAAVATVHHGVVRGVSKGETQIWVSAKDKVSHSIILRVTEPILTGIQLSQSFIILPAGFSVPLSVLAIYSDGSTVDVTALSDWKVSLPDKLQLRWSDKSSPVSVFGQEKGVSLVVAEFGGKTSEAQVTVTHAKLVGIQVTPPYIFGMHVGDSTSYYATGIFDDITTLDLTHQVSWSHSRDSEEYLPFTFDGNIAVQSLMFGSALVYAKMNDIVSLPAFHGGSFPTEQLDLSPKHLELPVGFSSPLVLKSIIDDGEHQIILNGKEDVPWKISQLDVAGIIHRNVVGLTAGWTKVSAARGQYSSEITVRVKPVVLTAISITRSTESLPVGFSDLYQATGVFSDGSEYDITSHVSWRSDNPAAASAAFNRITARQQGQATITASMDGISMRVFLQTSLAKLKSIQVVPSSLSMRVGQTSHVSAIGHFNDGWKCNISDQVTWLSDDPTHASVVSGEITAAKKGDIRVAAHIEGLISNVSVDIE